MLAVRLKFAALVTAIAGLLALAAIPTAQVIVTPSRIPFQMPAGIGGQQAAPCGVLKGLTSTTQAATTAVVTEENLYSVSLPGGTLDDDGEAIRIFAFGTVAANANAKTIKLYFGAATLQTYNAGTGNNLSWWIEATVIRTGAATQLGMGALLIGGTHTNNVLATPTETLSGAVTIRVTGQNGTASAGDIVFRGAKIECLGT